MASVASVAVELYEFCFSCFRFPMERGEQGLRAKSLSLMYSLPSTQYTILFKMCLSELIELTERSEKYICQS